MEELDAVFNTIKVKIRDKKHLSLKAECQSQANKIEIWYLTAETGNARADIDLQQDRLDNYSGQLELESTLREGLGRKVDQFENTTEKLEATVQTLVEEGQQKEERIGELTRQVEAIYALGYPTVMNTGAITTVVTDQIQAWE